jgi:hypothetical protein
MDLRPLSIGELFDRAFVLYRRHFWLFVGITAVPGVFALVLTLINTGIQNPALQGLDPESAEFEAAMMGMMWAVGGMMIILVIYFIVYMVALGATTFAVSEVYLGRTASIAQVYGRMKRRTGALLWLLFLVGIRLFGIWMLAMVMFGMATAIHPVIGAVVGLGAAGAAGLLTVFMMLRWGVSVPALVLEELSARRAITRSIELTRGRLGRVFLLGLCATMVTYGALALFQAPFVGLAMYVGVETWAGIALNAAGAILGTIATTLTSPFMIIGLALIYYDARIREEGFDLEVMLAALDGAPDPARV